MKWTNPGHEFDKIGHTLKNMEKIYIYGAGKLGGQLCKTLKALFRWIKWQITFIDFNEEKQRSGFMSLRVLPPESLEVLDKSKNFVVVCANEKNLPIMIKNAEDACFVQMENLFDYWTFIFKYLPIYFLHNLDMIFFYSVYIVPSTICNLSCNGCTTFIPFIKKHVNYKLDILFENVNIFFEKVDLCCHFQIGGGEPLLYPELIELVEYIGKRYRDRIIFFDLVTNGTIIPNDKLCNTFNKHKMRIFISNYGETVPLAKENVEKVFTKLSKFNNIDLIQKTVEQWWDFTPCLFSEKEHSIENLIKQYTNCNNWAKTLVNNTISSCAIAHSAEKAGLIEYCKENYLDLQKINSNNKSELVEFSCGFNVLGYVEFCKHCAGFRNNHNYIESGIQIFQK